MTSEDFQQNIRILLYTLFGALGSYGITTPDNIRTIILAGVGIVGNYVWTLYGTRLNGLLAQVKARTGVQSVEIHVDPAVIAPSSVTNNTPAGVVAKPST